MKTIAVLMLFLGISLSALAGCTEPVVDVPIVERPVIDEPAFKGQLPGTMADLFRLMEDIDQRHNTSLYTEAMDVENRFSDNLIYFFDWERTIPELEDIPSIIADFRVLRDQIAESSQNNLTATMLTILDVRMRMLDAELSYIEAFDEDSGRFSCKERSRIVDTNNRYVQAITLGRNVTKSWDQLLTHQEVTRPFFSEGRRPKFYDSPFYPIEKHTAGLIDELARFCGG